MADSIGGRPLLEARVRLRADGSALAPEAVSEAGKAAKEAADTYAKTLAKDAKAGLAAKKGDLAPDAASAVAASKKAGEKAGEEFSGALAKGAKAKAPKGLAPKAEDVAPEAKKSGEKAGEEFSKGFARRAVDGVTGAAKDASRRLGALTGAQLDGLDAIGDRAAIAGVAVAAGVGVAVHSFAEFDKAMSRAKAGTNATVGQMDALRAAAITAGKETQFSATEAADAITEMGKAGVSTADILSGGLDGALSLAAAGELEVGEAAGIAATALTQFGLKGEDLGHVADVLAAGAGKAQGSVSDLANGLKYAGPIASAFGISLDETVGTLAEFASQGIISEQAGTSLRSMLASLADPSVRASETMDELGLSAYDAQGNFIGMEALAGQLQATLGGLTQEQQQSALATIFGNEALTAATVLFKGGAPEVRRWTSAVNDSGFAAKQAATLMNNLSGDVEQLKGSLETAFISSGSGANDGLRSLTQGATGVVNAFLALPDPVQQSTVVIGGVTAAALLFTAAGVKGAVAVRRLRDDMVELGADAEKTKGALNRVGRAAGALALVTAGLDIGSIVTEATNQKIGIVSSDTEQLALDLAKFGKGADLAGEAAKGFGADLGGVDRSAGNLFTRVEGLKQAVNDLSGANGFSRKDLPFVGSPEADQIKKYSEALANLAAKDGPAAAQAFDRLAQKAGLNAEEQDRLIGLMPEYRGYLASVAAQEVASGKATGDAATATGVLKRQIAGAGNEAKDFAKALEEANAAAKDFNNTNLDARGAARGYQEALAAATEAVKENGRAHGNTTEAGRANEAALDDLAQAARSNADGILETTGSQEKFEKSLKEGRTALIRSAISMGYTKEEAKKLADKILTIPKVAKTHAQLTGAGDVYDALTGIITRVNALDGRQIQIYANAANVREDRRAHGGPIPGTPSEVDTEPYLLAKGEFVVRSREASKPGNRKILDAMNSGQDLTGLGAVAAPVVSGGGGSVDTAALAAAVTQGVMAAMQALGPGRVMLNENVVGQFLRVGGSVAGVDGQW